MVGLVTKFLSVYILLSSRLSLACLIVETLYRIACLIFKFIKAGSRRSSSSSTSITLAVTRRDELSEEKRTFGDLTTIFKPYPTDKPGVRVGFKLTRRIATMSVS